MWDDLKSAAREGVLLGVKYGIAAILTLWAVAWLLGDYSILRQRAFNGQRAHEFLAERAPEYTGRAPAQAPAPAPAPEEK